MRRCPINIPAGWDRDTMVGGWAEAPHSQGAFCAVHKVCTGPRPTCIVVPSTRNNEPCYPFI